MNFNNTPRISILLPTYNGDIDKMLKAIESLKNQSYSHFECIIVDDSDDNLVIDFLNGITVSDKRFKYFRGKGKGIAAALNFGLSLSKGEFIARSDDTDISNLNRLELQINFLIKNPDIGVVGSNIEVTRNGRKITRHYPKLHSEIIRSLFFTCPVAHSSVMIRRSILNDCGGYDENFLFCEDLELWIRLIRKGIKFCNIQSTLVYFENDIVIRSKEHFLSNSRARLKHSMNIFIAISFGLSFLHFLIPASIRSKIKGFFE